MKVAGILSGAAGWGVAGVFAVALATTGAFAATTGGGSSDATTTTMGKDGAGARSVLMHWGARLEHAQGVVKSKRGDESVLIQRGSVTSVDAHSMTVRSGDGWTATWTFNDKTRVRSQGKKSDLAEIKDGEIVVVAGPGSGHSGTARIVRDRDVNQTAPASTS